MRYVRILFGLLALSAVTRAAESSFDQVEGALTVSAWKKMFRAKLSGTLDFEAYELGQPAPGLLFTRSHLLGNPRLTVFLDERWGTIFYGFIQARLDHGFDPNSETRRARLDEYTFRFAPWSDGRLGLQIGKFGSVMGNWVSRHNSWDNAFIGAPLPYENVTPISDLAAPVSARAFVAPSADEKYDYNPIVWGPTYASGAAVLAKSDRFDAAFEVKNAGPASRPDAWSVRKVGFGAPAAAVRLGFRPDLKWNFGISASDSAYLLPEAASTLPVGGSRRDFRQRLYQCDAAYAWHHLQIWGELFESTFDVPRVGTVRSEAAYVEIKYKFTPQLYSALRVNRQIFSKIDTGLDRLSWAPDTWRFDAAMGYRINVYTQVKLQVSYEQKVALKSQVTPAIQLTLRF